MMKRFFLTIGQVGTFGLSAFGGFYERIAPPEDNLKFWTGLASLVGRDRFHRHHDCSS
jgi:hypothetical protein